jgi:hypothetical protein
MHSILNCKTLHHIYNFMFIATQAISGRTWYLPQKQWPDTKPHLPHHALYVRVGKIRKSIQLLLTMLPTSAVHVFSPHSLSGWCGFVRQSEWYNCSKHGIENAVTVEVQTYTHNAQQHINCYFYRPKQVCQGLTREGWW